jgi:hypothetical protein
VPSTADPVLRFFADIDPRYIMITPPPGPSQPATEARVVDRPEPDAEPEEMVEAEVFRVNAPSLLPARLDIADLAGRSRPWSRRSGPG